jgi:alpha-amylase/alpha-mannosidase (GH57 family)
MAKYVCIHGHFYQPPRENPWFGKVEVQEGAAPYHDWNQKITAECYAPNLASRILDSQGNILAIMNNYTLISFNFGPTLLSWMEMETPEVYKSVLEADKKSSSNFSGHGSAMAQAYNHMIMPLANWRDKKTQVLWGVADFAVRFKRRPEGMWLPETAVDLETLEIMAGEGIRFTILAPHQAASIRSLEGGEWTDVSDGNLDIRRPYLCKLPSGRSIAIFFYERDISNQVAFSDLLSSGEGMVKRILGAFSDVSQEDQLVTIATDGETYGHHHKFGEMALSYCLHLIKEGNSTRLTNFGERLAIGTPSYEVRIRENTSWSCSHGVDRWKDDCGCGGSEETCSGWRRPLREAMDWLRDSAATLYEGEASMHIKDPWEARDDYISVVLDRSSENVEAFLAVHSLRGLAAEEKIRVLRLLEMQRNAMLMYTSCGWFFDDISGIEAMQVMKYAAMVIQLAGQVAGVDLEHGYLERLREAKSSKWSMYNGEELYLRLIKPEIKDVPAFVGKVW